MDREPEIKEGSYVPENIKGDIEFKNVSFKYKDEEVLTDITSFLRNKCIVKIRIVTLK